MYLDKYELGYFYEQVSLAVKSLGFEEPDVDFTKKTLETVFGKRCSPPATVIRAEDGPLLQSSCIAEGCPLDANATCDAYPNGGFGQYPVIANATLVGDIVKENGTSLAAASSSEAVASSASATGSFASNVQTGSATSAAAATSASSSSGADSLKCVHSSTMIVGSVMLIVAAGAFSLAF